MAVYTLLGSTWAGVLTMLAPSQWALPMGNFLLVAGLLAGLILPGAVLVMLVLAVPHRLAEETEALASERPGR
jgi:hypothetical protein